MKLLLIKYLLKRHRPAGGMVCNLFPISSFDSGSFSIDGLLCHWDSDYVPYITGFRGICWAKFTKANLCKLSYLRLLIILFRPRSSAFRRRGRHIHA